MRKLSPEFQEAMNLLCLDPMPLDAEKRLEVLETRSPNEEAAQWADIWEYYTVKNIDEEVFPEL